MLMRSETRLDIGETHKSRLRLIHQKANSKAGPNEKYPDAILEGYLEKRGEVQKGFKRRYFVLLDSQLLYFSSHDTKKPNGQIALTRFAEVGTQQEGDRNFFLCAQKGGRFYEMKAITAEEAQIWTDAIAGAIAKSAVETVAAGGEAVARTRAAGGFFTGLGEGVLQSVQGLLTNILVGVEVGQTACNDLASIVSSGEDGRRAFCYVLNEVLLRTAAVNSMSDEAATQGFDMMKYRKGIKPQKKLIKIDGKTGVVSWGSRWGGMKHIDLHSVVSLAKGRVTKVWEGFPEAKDECCLSLLVKEGKNLDLMASNKMDRDNLYWALKNIRDRRRLEQQGVAGSSLVLPKNNFQVVAALTNLCLTGMHLETADMPSVLILMNAGIHVCGELASPSPPTPSAAASKASSANKTKTQTYTEERDTQLVFLQEYLTSHFSSQPTKFWETVFWGQTVQALRAKREANGELAAEQSSLEQLMDLVEQIMLWIPKLWGWGLDSHDIKEVVKLLHGSRENQMSDSVLMDLFRAVDAVAAIVEANDNRAGSDISANIQVRMLIKEMRTKGSAAYRAAPRASRSNPYRESRIEFPP